MCHFVFFFCLITIHFVNDSGLLHRTTHALMQLQSYDNYLTTLQELVNELRFGHFSVCCFFDSSPSSQPFPHRLCLSVEKSHTPPLQCSCSVPCCPWFQALVSARYFIEPRLSLEEM